MFHTPGARHHVILNIWFPVVCKLTPISPRSLVFKGSISCINSHGCFLMSAAVVISVWFSRWSAKRYNLGSCIKLCGYVVFPALKSNYVSCAGIFGRRINDILTLPPPKKSTKKQKTSPPKDKNEIKQNKNKTKKKKKKKTLPFPPKNKAENGQILANIYDYLPRDLIY